MSFSLDLNIIEFLILSVSLVFIMEGILYSLFPNYMKKVSKFVLDHNEDKIRFIGLIFSFIGLVLIYFILKVFK